MSEAVRAGARSERGRSRSEAYPVSSKRKQVSDVDLAARGGLWQTRARGDRLR